MADAMAKDATWGKWHDEMELAAKAKGYRNWKTRAEKIVKRFRDERSDVSSDSDSDTYSTGSSAGGARFNILWSNVQTLQPALFAKSPKPVVERRYLDRDDIGRTASVILERALLYELDSGTYYSSLKKAVLDRLLPGRGVVWVRYEPKFSPMPEKVQGTKDGEQPAKVTADNGPDDGDALDSNTGAEPQEQVASESVPVDYIDWKDFATSPSRTWEEVWWIRKRVYMTRAELTRRFGDVGKKVPLDWSPDKTNNAGVSATKDPAVGPTPDEQRARILEIWDKSTRKVYWMAEGWSEQMLDEKDDPLQLEDFWPTPKPLFATLTNDTLVPIPDFCEYQDQAIELDNLTARIGALTKAIKVAGVFDASVPELQRMFEEGFENELVPADNMAEFSQKAGANGMGHIWLLPVKDMVFTLNELYAARDRCLQVIFQVTGISDIVRGGESQGAAKTATEQRIKGQFASMRLNEMQAEVARFARDILRIMGEIIAEHYDPMTLYLVSGYEQYAKEQFPPEAIPAQQMGHNGGPPLDHAPPSPMVAGAPGGGPPAAAGLLPPPNPEDVARKKAADIFTAAVKLLRNDKLRGFRIDIETDSLIEPDQQATQQARTELLGAISQFLPQAMEAAQFAPEMKPLMARLLMFFLRGFKASRDIETAFEQFIDDVTKEAANPKPKPPSPEEVKANAEIQKQQMEQQRQQQQAQLDQQKAQQDIQLEQAKAKLEIEREQMKLQIERERLQMEREKMAMQIQGEQQKSAIQAQAAERNAALDEQTAAREQQMAEADHGRNMEAGERQHELAMETAEFKAKEAKKPKAKADA